jgi:hypothetical protein
MRLRQFRITTGKRFGSMCERQNSHQGTIHISARCYQHCRYISVLLIYASKQRVQQNFPAGLSKLALANQDSSEHSYDLRLSLLSS